MQFVPSVSRSSGLENGGDVLKRFEVQGEYRSFIETKLEGYWHQYPLEGHVTMKADDSQRHAQSNISIFFRKLREGLMASQRLDDFALEVYETSLHLSVLFRIPAQTTSIVSQLLPHGPASQGLYKSYAELSSPTSLADDLAELSIKTEIHAREAVPSLALTMMICLLNSLTYAFPSQIAYHSQLRWIRASFFGLTSAQMQQPLLWLKSVATALAGNDYARFGLITTPAAVRELLETLQSHGSTPGVRVDLSNIKYITLLSLIEELRIKMRPTVWKILRTSYRELDTTLDADWLLESLGLFPSVTYPNKGTFLNKHHLADEWLAARGEAETKQREGMTSRWILFRSRSQG
ncbi:hypothetical protein BU17DRAFT_44168 [Hysterangium stoloniferum]|nr:hypothetical protein BU17DRAFT_44168 [Hysterangium stoloniferum]